VVVAAKSTVPRRLIEIGEGLCTDIGQQCKYWLELVGNAIDGGRGEGVEEEKVRLVMRVGVGAWEVNDRGNFLQVKKGKGFS
jgi:hypothetical protein